VRREKRWIVLRLEDDGVCNVPGRYPSRNVPPFHQNFSRADFDIYETASLAQLSSGVRISSPSCVGGRFRSLLVHDARYFKASVKGFVLV